ncbi:MAG: pyruvate kinase [Puniceicoccaceae bacterium]|nr:MAG: pyruvate kinase [Puniceicoccaceae bacterium]
MSSPEPASAEARPVGFPPPDDQGSRRAKIVFTIGPATEDPETLRQILLAGGDVCRINMAHASHEWTLKVLRRIREAGEAAGRPIATMMDVKGPEIRTGDLDQTLHLEPGEIFDFTIKPGGGDGASSEEVRSVDVNYRNLVNDVRVGDTVLVDNGLIRMEVLEKDHSRIRCKVMIPGPLSSRRHINLPGVKVNLPALTEKDKADIHAGMKIGLDYIALSFVREAADIATLRDFLEEHRYQARIIAKIEDQQAISNLREIVSACDGLMVARGDLGIECPFEELPMIQRHAVRTCLALGRPVIVATHLLESMIQSPMPTRAEVTDVANAIFEQVDAIMLSGETTVGKYPVPCVQALDKIARRCEGGERAGFAGGLKLGSDRAKILRSAVVMADELHATGLIAFTRSGAMAVGLASMRPRHSPIFAFTNSAATFRRLRLHWGVEPFQMVFGAEPEHTIQKALATLLYYGRARRGDKVVVVSDILASDRLIDSIQLRTVE